MSWKDGVITTDAGELIARPKMSFGESRASPLGAAAKIKELSPGYPRIIIKPVLIGGYECCATVTFEHDKLDEAVIVVTDKTAERFSFVTAYASPSDGPEVKFLENWVRREVGTTPPVDFTWGRIVPIFDPIAGFARIKFLYGARR